jgi:hypothetical protein
MDYLLQCNKMASRARESRDFYFLFFKDSLPFD